MAFVVVAALTVAVADPAMATTYVAIEDGTLADQSPLIVLGTVLDAAPAPDSAAVDYHFEVSRVIKGSADGVIVVRVPGGLSPEGDWFELPAAPAFDDGEEALLMLQERSDGSYALNQLMLGAFRVVEADDRRVVTRSVNGTVEIGADSSTRTRGRGRRTVVRDLEPFAAFLADRARDQRSRQGNSSAAYLLELPAEKLDSIDRELGRRTARRQASLRAEASARFLADENDVRVRWFAFDRGETVGWTAVGDGATVSAEQALHLERALAAWSSAAEDIDVRLAYEGPATAQSGLRAPDGINAVLWGDPNDEIGGSFDCAAGGLVAIGGNWFRAEATTADGSMFREIYEGDVVIQDGADCVLAAHAGADGEEVLAHEIGHSLGLGHGCDEPGLPSCASSAWLFESLMRPILHSDGRGASFRGDEVQALRYLYGRRDGRGEGVGGFQAGTFTLVGSGLDAPVTVNAGTEPDAYPLSGDWDGDGVDELGCYSHGRFVLLVPDGLTNINLTVDDLGWLPISGDWDGDGVDTIGLFRDGAFILYNDHVGQRPTYSVKLGGSEDLPVAGDWDGDGRDDVGVFDRATGTVTLRVGDVESSYRVGQPGDLPVAGDWDGDGVDTLGLFREGLFVLLEGHSSDRALLTMELPGQALVPLAGRW